YHVDGGRILIDRFAFQLSDATHHSDHQIAIVWSRCTNLADPRVDFSFGTFTHRTRIEQHHIRVVRRTTQFIARFSQACGCTFRVGNVHLAAESFDVYL